MLVEHFFYNIFFPQFVRKVASEVYFRTQSEILGLRFGLAGFDY